MKKSIIVLLFIAFFVMPLVTIWADKPAGKEIKLKLKEKESIARGSLRVSHGGEKVLFRTQSFTQHGVRPNIAGWLMDTKTGKLRNLADMIEGLPKNSQIQQIKISSDGKKILVVTQGSSPKASSAIFLLDMASEKGKKIFEGENLFAVWVGEKIAISQAGEDMKVLPIIIFDPKDNSKTKFSIRGILSCADSKGKILLITANAEKPTDEINVQALMRNGSVLLTDTKGTILKTFKSKSNIVLNTTSISPSGKFISFLVAKATQKAPPTFSLSIISTNDNQKKDLKGFISIIKITDTGAIVIIDGPFQKNTIRTIDAEGNSTTLAENVIDAIVEGNKLYYISKDNSHTLKILNLPTDSKTTDKSQVAK